MIDIGKDEAIEITISVVSISFALALVFTGVGGLLGQPKEFLLFMLPLLVTVGSGFILHEMAHKLVAIFYGAEARFKMWTQGLLVMLAGSVIGILFAAPGAVYIYSNQINKRENGLISIVGPLTNFALVIVFVALNYLIPINQYFTFLAGEPALRGFGIINGTLQVWRFGAAMNLMLALFNMIPAFPLDGSKVYRWNRLVWLGTVGVLLGIGTIVISPGVIISWGIMLVFFTLLSKLLFG